MLSFVGSLAKVNKQTKNKAEKIADYCQLYCILLDCTLLKANKKRMGIIDTIPINFIFAGPTWVIDKSSKEILKRYCKVGKNAKQAPTSYEITNLPYMVKRGNNGHVT